MSAGTIHVLPEVPIEKNAEPVAVVTSEPDSTTYHLLEKSIDYARPMKVIVIGAGFSGITAGIRLPQKIKNLELIIYEREDAVGGTWCINKYPGLACDIPAHCYQLTFEPNPSWSAFYAPGPEIREYLQKVHDKYKVGKYMKLKHEVKEARWDVKASKWRLKIHDIANDSTFEDEADVVIAGMGGLARWDWPKIEGLRDYKGVLLHSAQWDSDLGLRNDEAWKDKTVAVIGVGSSGIQLVPALQKVCKNVVNYVRGKTWISTPFASQALLARQPDGSNHQFTEEEIDKFTKDPDYYFGWRKELETELNSVHGGTLNEHPMQKGARQAFKGIMEKKLEKKPWIAKHLIPEFPVACRRLTPGPGYLEALVEDNVDFVTSEIRKFTETGIETVDGDHREFDAIVCATGFDTSGKHRFPIIGRDGVDMRDAYEPYPKTYLTIANYGFPNWFQTLGPNSAIGSGSLLVMLEREIDYAVQVVAKLQKERYKSIEVKKEAVEDFDQFMENYFPRTVYSQKCRSWYKMGKEEGRIVGIWPGSCLHAVTAFENPRWEDFNYEPLDDGVRNRFYYLGDGWSENEKSGEGDRSWYLNNIDYPPVPVD